MFIFQARDNDRMFEAVVDGRGVFPLANLFEKSAVLFKVVSSSGAVLDQHDFGYGGFVHWLSEDDKF
jgi:hypothetical protein